MLNRRILRIKAMQAIYAYVQAEGSNYLLALDRIADTFAPDLMAIEAQDRKLLEGQKQIATLLFKEWYETKKFDTEEKDREILNAAQDAVNFYQNSLKKDYKSFGNQMLTAVEEIYDRYLLTLLVMQEVTHLIEGEEKKAATRFTERTDVDLRGLLRNKALTKLQDNKFLEQRVIRRNVSWAGNLDVVQQIYKNGIKKDEQVLAYLDLVEPTYEQDHELLKHLYKNVIFKDENLQGLFEEQDLNWVENKSVVKSLVNKSIKMLEETTDEHLPLLDLSASWDDDKAFFEELYHETLKDDAKYEAMISESVQNWDVERVALIDKIILKMALCEMHIFRSIPVKVTINEYIEISKVYSTPKSKQFVNGVLDKLSQQLTASGAIRKSGRGLLDNK
ncbi:transcription antitermination factor NusB [Nibribacter ruber]|uniref:Transcription antitermination factor NusB n=1 Tax=Nibribacter ruber TaxID=2698458 RepID=A0A6P1P206_9BACT|nr:transcription antitermination factor NusB [Nibribacter ruber]QHL88282.1 transcription antitermination factor NusB [Nibribacter ruber]